MKGLWTLQDWNLNFDDLKKIDIARVDNVFLLNFLKDIV